MKQKYVIGLALQDINNRRLECILFAETMTHKDAAELFQFGEDVVSAGFFDLHYNGPQALSGDGTAMTAGSITATVHGRSETLDVGGQPFDEYYVRRALGLRQRDATVRDRIADYRLGREIIDARRKKEEARTSGAPRDRFRHR